MKKGEARREEEGFYLGRDLYEIGGEAETPEAPYGEAPIQGLR